MTPGIDNVSTDFEFSDSDGFLVGITPFAADFQGGVAESRGNAALYVDGTFSWHVGDTATIDFETPISELEFFSRTVTAGDIAAIQVFDEFGLEISNLTVPDAFQQFSYVVDPGAGEPRIGSVSFTVTSGEIVVDALTYDYPNVIPNDDIGCSINASDAITCIFGLSRVNPGAVDFSSVIQGQLSLNGNTVSGTATSISAPSKSLADGSIVSSFDISGTVVVDSTLNLSATIGSASFDISMTPEADLFQRASGLNVVQAVYSTAAIYSTDLAGDMTSFEIDASGAVQGQLTTGCVISGQVDVPDTAVNRYELMMTFDAATCGAISGSYSGPFVSQDLNAQNDAFSYYLFSADSLRLISGIAVK